jgi:hypothetical protein
LSSFIQIASGHIIDPLNPDPDLVNIEDIAHALSIQNRYNGHTKEPYSVAEHVVRASLLADAYGMPYVSLWTLHHDDPEAYIGDLASPLKSDPGFGQRFRGTEDRLMRAICEHFGLNPKQPHGVKEADMLMLKWEVRDLMPKPTAAAREVWKPWLDGLPPAPLQKIKPWGWKKAKLQYLARHAKLVKELEEEK